MFCYHCQEAKKNVACDTTGICGKKADVSSLHDLLTYTLKGLAFFTTRAEAFDLVNDKTHRFIAKALYSMVTNVNFTAAEFVALIDESMRRRESIKQQFLAAYELKQGAAFSEPLPEEARWLSEQNTLDAFIEKGEQEGVQKALEWLDPDVHGLQECLLYAVKGLGAMAVHNLHLGIENQSHYQFMQDALAFTLNKDNSTDQVMEQLLHCGQLGLDAMQQFEQHNAERFGQPEPTTVHLDSWSNPAILVSGHDLQDIEDLLIQTQGTGVDVYTHGEALSAHAYPALKKYFNLAGNYGGAWQDQKTEFPKFNGPILVTTNSIQQPKKTYLQKIFSTGMVGWPDVPHIADRKPGQRKDFSALIDIAKNSEAPTPLSETSVTTGYGHQALQALVEPVATMIKEDKIKRVLVMAGTDGRHKERRYFTQLAEALPQNVLILTAGDNKYRFNQLDMGEIEGIPRVLDAGQSTGFCHIIEFLKSLQQQLHLDSLNALPLSFDLAWYEQKTILMMLALFSLDCRNLRIGPTLPPFFTENILHQLDARFQFKGIGEVEADLEAMLAGQ